MTPISGETGDLLTRTEVLDLLRSKGRVIAASTWSSYVAREQAPQPAKHIGRTPLWNRSEVEQWVVRSDR